MMGKALPSPAYTGAKVPGDRATSQPQAQRSCLEPPTLVRLNRPSSPHPQLSLCNAKQGLDAPAGDWATAYGPKCFTLTHESWQGHLPAKAAEQGGHAQDFRARQPAMPIPCASSLGSLCLGSLICRMGTAAALTWGVLKGGRNASVCVHTYCVLSAGNSSQLIVSAMCCLLRDKVASGSTRVWPLRRLRL